MHFLAYSTFLLILVLMSVATQEDKWIDDHGKFDIDWEEYRVIKVPPCDPKCKRARIDKWEQVNIGKFFNCSVNVGGCKPYRCGKPGCPDCRFVCAPVYMSVKCGCGGKKKITKRVVSHCDCKKVTPVPWLQNTNSDGTSSASTVKTTP